VIAHVAGLPFEETIVQLAPAGVGVLLLMRLVSERIRRLAGRLVRPAWSARSRER
jgi:hypothetical protein